MRRHARSGSLGDIPDDDLEKTNDNEKQGTKIKNNDIKDYIVDYTNNSNLHGLKYIGEKERTYVEKIFWLIAFICCVVLCSCLIRQVWIKWNISPVIVSFAENPTPVWQIPYPAVTICGETKTRQKKFNFTEYFHLYRNKRDNLTEELKNLFEDVTMICDDHLAPSIGRNFSEGADITNNIKMVSPTLTDVFFECTWKDTPVDNCSMLFSPVVTEEGICYTFNTLRAEELFRTENLHKDYPYLEHDKKAGSWNLDEGYAPNTPIETYPNRGSGYGAKSGLTFVLKANTIDLDYLCRGPVQGFKILLHNAAELPRLSQQYFRSPLSQEIVVSVKPKLMTTSEGLRPYDPERRQCYFPNERYLRYFKVYTQANCQMECLANFTYARCGCVHFGMPHATDMAVCNAGRMACIKKSQMELVTIGIQSAIDKKASDTEALNRAREVSEQCQCLLACTSIEYEAETSQADYDWEALYRANKSEIPVDLANVSYSRVMIFFKEAQFITSRRSELYGQTDFLASCGGLLGLFMGFSFISLIELIYFLTLRLCCVFFRRQNTLAPVEFPSATDNKTHKF
ncbi:pickpocket protein 28 [Manduca sexta]|uniref:pickpocket protein 28 n=1 Tax=Manduca sexta TaxID=7130 RepID=UPI00188F11BA|nr:pickpocket protein 28 [Manduca sexta]